MLVAAAECRPAPAAGCPGGRSVKRGWNPPTARMKVGWSPNRARTTSEPVIGSTGDVRVAQDGVDREGLLADVVGADDVDLELDQSRGVDAELVDGGTCTFELPDAARRG